MTLPFCPACDGSEADLVVDLGLAPVLVNRLLPDAETARQAPVGEIALAFCNGCGLIWNRAFDAQLLVYGSSYENPLHFSPGFRDFAGALADYLVARHRLTGGRVAEIGCGDGYMLERMLDAGVAAAEGFDPSMAGREREVLRKGLTITAEAFRPGQIGAKFDMVLCRHVLEHLERPASFLAELRPALAERSTPLYLETPNAGWMLSNGSIWDAIYEHATFWCAPAMEGLLRREGLVPLRIAEGYGGQFLMADGVAAAPQRDRPAPNLAALRDAARRFGAAAEATTANWRRRLERLSGPAVIWGAGSKGISFANSVAPASQSVVALVDLNPRKWGMHIPGSGLPVIAPEDLREIDPRLVLVANPRYFQEIGAYIREIGVRSGLESIASCSS